MSKLPLWVMGYAMQRAGVPCAEEIAMMLCRRKLLQTANFSSFSGSYHGTERVDSAGKYSDTTHEFAVGKFPTNPEYVYSAYYDKSLGVKSEGTIAIVLDAASVLQTKAGDYVRIRYILPYQISGNLSAEATHGYGSDPNTITVDVSLDSAAAVNGEKKARYKVTTTGGHEPFYMIPDAPVFGNADNSQYCPMLKNARVQTLTDGEDIIGWELEGVLRYPVDKILIDITGHFGGANYCMSVSARVQHDDLQIEVYE